jgi:hypothetical protein
VPILGVVPKTTKVSYARSADRSAEPRSISISSWWIGGAHARREVGRQGTEGRPSCGWPRTAAAPPRADARSAPGQLGAGIAAAVRPPHGPRAALGIRKMPLFKGSAPPSQPSLLSLKSCSWTLVYHARGCTMLEPLFPRISRGCTLCSNRSLAKGYKVGVHVILITAIGRCPRGLRRSPS